MTALESVQRLRTIAEKLEKAIRDLADPEQSSIALDETSFHAIYERVDLACWTFGTQAADEERCAELRAVVEAATKIQTISNDEHDAAR